MKAIENWLTAMVLTLTGIAMLALAGVVWAAPAEEGEKRADAPKAADALILTEADNGKTVRVPAGRLIEVRLEGEKPRTGWEASPLVGKCVARDGAPPAENDHVCPAAIFTAAKDAADKAIGTYAFRFRTVEPGMAKLEFSYHYPGGPEVKQRLRTALIRSVTIKIEVVESGK